MFHPNTDVKANLKLLTINELSRLLKRGMGVGMNLHVLSDYVALFSILFKKNSNINSLYS